MIQPGARLGATPGSAQPQLRFDAHIGMSCPPAIARLAAAAPLWCNPRLSAAGAARSQGVSIRGGAFLGSFQAFTLDSGWGNYSGKVKYEVFLN